MPDPKTLAVLASRWQADPNDIYVFTDGPDPEMVADDGHEPQDLESVINDVCDLITDAVDFVELNGTLRAQENSRLVRATEARMREYAVTRARGVGHGLDQRAIIERIVEDHNARLWTTFQIDDAATWPGHDQLCVCELTDGDGHHWYRVGAFSTTESGQPYFRFVRSGDSVEEAGVYVESWQPLSVPER